LAAKRAERDRTATPEGAGGAGDDRDLALVVEQRQRIAELLGDHGKDSPLVVPAQAGTQHPRDSCCSGNALNARLALTGSRLARRRQKGGEIMTITAPSQIETFASDQASRPRAVHSPRHPASAMGMQRTCSACR